MPNHVAACIAAGGDPMRYAILRNQNQKQLPLAIITTLKRLGIELSRYRLEYTGSDYHEASTRFVIDHTIEDTPAGDAVSRVATDMVSELTVHAFSKRRRRTSILALGLVTWLHDPLRPCE
ncbi:hypothetical protein TNCV_4187691 [Trichonephila clavipes]|nr:hypothetical protein TNCV_4187691 [Trichonephila clavipes]